MAWVLCCWAWSLAGAELSWEERARACLAGALDAPAADAAPVMDARVGDAPDAGAPGDWRALARTLLLRGGYDRDAALRLFAPGGDENQLRIDLAVRRLDERLAPSRREAIPGVPLTRARTPRTPSPAGLGGPGTLALLPALAVAYVREPGDGAAAAAHLALLSGDGDPTAEGAARAAFWLLAGVLSGEEDRDATLRRAAAGAENDEVARALKSLRVKEWKHLPPEDAALGRLLRTVFLWYRAPGGPEMTAEATRWLADGEARAFAWALAGAAYGERATPPERLAALREIHDLARDLADMGREGLVLSVADPPDPVRAAGG